MASGEDLGDLLTGSGLIGDNWRLTHMHLLRRTWLSLIPLSIFILLALALAYYDILDLGSQALLLLFGVYVVAQAAKFAASHTSARRSRRTRALFQDAIDRISLILRMPKIISMRDAVESYSAQEIAWKIYTDALRAENLKIKLFLSLPFVKTRSVLSYPPEFNASEAFIDEVWAHYKQKGADPLGILWSSPSFFGKFASDLPQLQPLATIEEPVDSRYLYHRAIAANSFSADYCLTIPLHSEIFTDTDVSGTHMVGFIGMMSSSFLTPAVSSHYRLLAHRFEDLYNRVRSEGLSHSVDRVLNEELLSELGMDSRNPLQYFQMELVSIICEAFYADHVEIWLRGTKCPPSLSIRTITQALLQSDYSDLGASVGAQIGGYRYHLDQPIELANCPLGFIRVLRHELPFTEFEKALLEKFETEIDNFVRDLWAHAVLRRIDRDVFNPAFREVHVFAKELIKKIVSELDLAAGGLWIFGEYEASHVSRQSEVERWKARLTALKRDYEAVEGIELDTRDGFSYICLRIGIGPENPLGLLCVAKEGRLSDIHVHILKRIESQADNILKLYKNLAINAA